MIGRYIESDPIGINQGRNHLFGYAANNPINLIDPNGLTFTTNWEFFWDWVLEKGNAKRDYGEGTIELQEMRTSPGADKMRAAFKAGKCNDLPTVRLELSRVTLKRHSCQTGQHFKSADSFLVQ